MARCQEDVLPPRSLREPRSLGAQRAAPAVGFNGEMNRPSATELLAVYDAQFRARLSGGPIAPGEAMELDGPVIRFLGGAGRGIVLSRDLGGLEGPALDALIARQVAVFADRGEAFEWRTHGHDRFADLPDRLRAAGFVAQDTGTVMVGRVDDIAAEPRLPDGVGLREVTSRREFERIAKLEAAIWGEDLDWLPDMLEGEQMADPERLVVTIAEAGDQVVCAAWIRFHRGTEFATLLGGATLAEWRRRGIYRATVAYRANVAATRRFRSLDVDASDESRPILERLGLVPVTTATAYIWTPPSRGGA